jgi:hypothetical protein
MKTHTKLIALSAGVAVAAAAYAHLLSSPSNTPSAVRDMPSPTEEATAAPNQSTQSTAVAPAASAAHQKDPVFLSSQFESALQCQTLSINIRQMQADNDICESQAGQAEAYSKCKAATEAARPRLTHDLQQQKSCSADPEVLGKQYKAAVTDAARAGDPNAQVCFVYGNFKLDDGEAPSYRKEASGYLAGAIARGDWRAVQLLSTPSESVAHGGAGAMATLPVIGAPFTVYRANKLLSLGASSKPYQAMLQSSADEAARSLTPAQIENADTWAHQTFERHFKDSPQLAAAPVPCTPSAP